MPTDIVGWFRRLNIPLRDPRFWAIQLMVLGIDIGHLLLESVEVLGGESEFYLLSVSVLLIPIVYAALSFGLRGALPTALWAMVLSVPEISAHDWMTQFGILTQFAIVTAIAIIVAIRVDRERAAARASEQANLRLSRLNATAAAVAGSLDLDHVLRDTLRAKLDPKRRQVAWIRLLPLPDSPGQTMIDSRGVDPPTGLSQVQEGLTLAACLTGLEQRDDATGAKVHTAVAPLKSEGITVGALGIWQPDDIIPVDEHQVLGAIANQLGVGLNNIRNHAETREALEALSRAKENLEIYIALATEAQEEERKRLSRELHDDILQSLVVAKTQIASADDGSLPGATHERLEGVQDILTDAMGNVRRYCKDLRPSLLDDLGLVDAIDWLVADLEARTAIAIGMDIVGPLQRLDAREELLIFRVVQEALHNVERHAHATTVRVGLDFSGECLIVLISDNGKGLPPYGRASGHGSEPGLGLRGMDERTKLLRGTLTIESQNGVGTRIRLQVPMSPATASPLC